MFEFPHGLMFHRLHHEGGSPAGQGSLTGQEFEKILHFVGIKHILSPEEWLLRLNKGILRQNDLCITFDDGLKCQYDVCLPILEKYNLQAFWFVYSCVFEGKIVEAEVHSYFIATFFKNHDEFFNLFLSRCDQKILENFQGPLFEKYVKDMRVTFPFYSEGDLRFRFIRNELLSKKEFVHLMNQIMEEKGVRISDLAQNLWLSQEQLKTLSQTGHLIGLHSYDHPLALAKLSTEDQKAQYTKNLNDIKNICGQTPKAMSHPLNSYNQDTLNILAELGITCGFRSNMKAPEGKNINPTPLEMSREDCTNILRTLQGA